MPLVRCKFYSESGKPLGGGCLKKTCAFVHPGDPRWSSAPPPSFRARDKGIDSGASKPWGGRGKHGTAASSPWGTGGHTGTSAPDTGSGWDTGGGRDAGGSTSTSNQAPEATRSRNSHAANAWDPSKSWNQATHASTRNGEDGWGASAHEASRRESTGDDGWGPPSWGPDKDAGEARASGSRSTGDNEWGTSGWGDNKGADKNVGSAWASAPDDGWGVGWGNDNGASTAWGTSDPTIADDQTWKEIGRGKGKGKDKAVIAPPRIRIPDNEDRKAKISGSNNEPLGPGKWGESRGGNLATSSTPVTISTPVATLTPTDSIRTKRKRDAFADDKSEIFKDYVKTWERAVRTRFLLAEAEVKRDRWFRTQKSACYARIGEAGRNRLDGQRTECDKEVSQQREKLSNAITSLVDFHDAISSKLDLGQRYDVGEEAQQFILESKAFVDEVRALLVARILKEKDDAQSSDNQKHPAHPTLMDTLQSQVRDLEERFEQAQTELTLSHQRDVRSEIDGLMAAKIEALRVARQHEVDRLASQPRPEIVVPPSALKSMEDMAQQVSKMETKVPHTVEDIRVLLFRVDAMTKRVSELEKEVSVNKEAYRQVQNMAVEKAATEQRMDEQLQTIREKFKQLAASQPSGSFPDLRDKLMESLRPAFETVLDKFYEQEVRPTIESLQQVVIEASDRHQEEAIKVLWGRIQPAMNMVAGVSRWLDSQELGLTAPVEGARPLAIA